MTTEYPENGANIGEVSLCDDSENVILVAIINIEGTTDESQKLKYYRIIDQCLEKSQPLTKLVLKRLLNACCRGLNEAKPSMLLVTVFDIISKIIGDILKFRGFCENELEKTAPALLRHLKSISTKDNKPYYIVTVGTNILLSYPEKILMKIAVNHTEDIFDIASLFFQDGDIEVTLNNNLIDLLIRILKLLPTQQKKKFAEAGLNVWFGKVIPALMHQILLPKPKILRLICLLELLTDVLVHVDYSRHYKWLQVLQSCCATDKYPATLATALKQGSPHWHTIWRIFIKLLNTQITQNFLSMGTPINSMLSVVETAFKMSVVERCHAFHCWNTLIDNFSQENVEPMLRKRIKLLMIPLNSNNVKLDETALAKFHTWWHFINKFQNKIQQYIDVILIPFLEYCFGKYESKIITPGLMYASVWNLSTQAFTEIVGHDPQCDGCIPDSFPKLEQKLLNSQLLVKYLPQWMHTLKQSIKIIIQNSNTPETEKRVYCLWSSFFQLLVSLPENNLRRDIVSQQLQVLSDLIIHEDKHTVQKLAPILFKLIAQLAKDDRFKALLKDNSKDDIKTSPICTLFNLILSPAYCNLCARLDFLQIVSNVRPILHIALNSTQTSKVFLEWLLQNLTYDDIGFALWITAIESIKDSHHTVEISILYNLFMWPLNDRSTIPDKVISQLNYIAKLWHYLYKHMQEGLTPSEKLFYKTSLLEKAYVKQKMPTTLLIFYFTVLLLKTDLRSKCESFDLEHYKGEILWLTSKINEKELSTEKELCVEVAEVLHLVLKFAKHVKDAILIETLLCDTMNLIPELLSDDTDKNLEIVENLIKELNVFFLKNEYQSSVYLVIDQLVALASYKKVNYREFVLNILQKCCEINKLETQIKAKLKTAISKVKHIENKADMFTTPKRKKEPKVVKKKIDGEDFVVVQNHWKFNPKKLTEHQKEVLNRKREDIPALYQDLSQSQDECKIISWKAPDGDSQNTLATKSSSNSVSKEPENFSSALKKIPNAEIVPNILDNIKISSNNNKESRIPEEKSLEIDANSTNTFKTMTKNVNNRKQTISEQALTPRLSIKDRIVQNMKSLAKRSLPTENVNDTNTTTFQCNTPNVPVPAYPETKEVIVTIPKVDQMNTSILTNPSVVVEMFNTKLDTNASVATSNLAGSVTPMSEDYVNKKAIICKSAPTTALTSERPPRLKRKPKKLITDFTELPLKRRKHAIAVSDFLTQDSQDQELGKCYEASELSEHDVHVDETDLDELQCGQVVESIDNVSPKQKIYLDGFQTANETTVKDSEKECVDIEKLSEESNLTKEPQTSNNIFKKKRKPRKSRLEKELEIDMVEGHPFLSASQLEKRKSRKSAIENIPKANSTEHKQNTSANKHKEDCVMAIDKNVTEITNNDRIVAKNTVLNPGQNCKQDIDTTHNLQHSADFIESSQDSSISVIQAKTPKRLPKKQTLQTITSLKSVQNPLKSTLSESIPANQEALNDESGKRLDSPPVIIDVTSNMDTQPMSMEENIINPRNETYKAKESNDASTIESVDIASVDTEPLDSCVFSNKENMKNDIVFAISRNNSEDKLNEDTTQTIVNNGTSDCNENVSDTPEQNSTTGLSSPFKDEVQRNEDFLNNTLNISPIKPSSPLNDNKKALSPKSSDDYVVITLSSPVHSNGEPADRSNTPEVSNDVDKSFSKEKSPIKNDTPLANVSPDKFHQSPPRNMTNLSNNSPRSLSLKRNRPQMKTIGRAAHMLGCVLGVSNQQTFMDSEKSNDSADVRTSPCKNPVRRNLKNSYENKEDNEVFLNFSKELPSASSSPSCPILKRKHANIVDDANTSPASKRKRVSFHDPPVSTTVVVQKYIDPASIKIPVVRITDLKCLKRHAHAVKPTTINVSDENNDTLLEDIDLSSSEQTPQVEIVKNSDLNDCDPICPELLHCNDPITNIALDLSSPAMKDLLVKELKGKVETVGDLAKLTELEVNRLCIKAPKVIVAKKVLSDYAATKMDRPEDQNNATSTKATLIDVNIQTMGVSSNDVAIQSDIKTAESHCQTAETPVSEVNVQTDDETSAQIMKLVLEIPDFICDVDKHSKEKLLDTLYIDDIIGILKRKIFSPPDIEQILNCVLRPNNTFDSTVGGDDASASLSFIQNYLCDNFSSQNLIMFCSNLLSSLHKKI